MVGTFARALSRDGCRIYPPCGAKLHQGEIHPLTGPGAAPTRRGLNQEGVEHAQNLIKGRQYEKDSDWSEAQPSAEEENRFIDENGWEAFAKWHLAYNTEVSEETKSRYKFPFGDFRRLHRSALIAAKQRAGSEDYDEVQRAAGRLLEMLPGEDDR
jgi:hypothetical protein